MNCPDCQQQLVLIGHEGVAMYECSMCQGRWLERDELVRSMGMKCDSLRWLDFDHLAKIPSPGAGSEGKICPRCLGKLYPYLYKESPAVVRKCGVCRGVWLSAKDIADILRQSSQWVTKNIPVRHIMIVAGVFMVVCVCVMVWFIGFYKAASRSDTLEEVLSQPKPPDYHADRDFHKTMRIQNDLIGSDFNRRHR